MDIRPFNSTQLPLPPQKSHLLIPKNQSVEIEIGCGVGLHPVQRATLLPETFFVGIEHTKEKFQKFLRRTSNHPHLKNLHAIHANAISWITHFVPKESVDRYWILYPNPYPKKKQQNMRWHLMPFMEKLLWTLKPGGELHLSTNMQYYADEAEFYFLKHWKLEAKSKQTLHINTLSPAGVAKTHFEKKYLLRGQNCYDLVFKKPTIS